MIMVAGKERPRGALLKAEAIATGTEAGTLGGGWMKEWMDGTTSKEQRSRDPRLRGRKRDQRSHLQPTGAVGCASALGKTDDGAGISLLADAEDGVRPVCSA